MRKCLSPFTVSQVNARAFITVTMRETAPEHREPASFCPRTVEQPPEAPAALLLVDRLS